jgi:hypothetical protein
MMEVRRSRRQNTGKCAAQLQRGATTKAVPAAEQLMAACTLSCFESCSCYRPTEGSFSTRKLTCPQSWHTWTRCSCSETLRLLAPRPLPWPAPPAHSSAAGTCCSKALAVVTRHYTTEEQCTGGGVCSCLLALQCGTPRHLVTATCLYCSCAPEDAAQHLCCSYATSHHQLLSCELTCAAAAG